MSIQRFSKSDPMEVIAKAVSEDGIAIVERLVEPEVMVRIAREMGPFVEATPIGTDEFSGRTTRRTGSLVARSEAARELAIHPTVIGVCDRLLGNQAATYQLHLTQIIDIGPGESAQMLHRDQWAWDRFGFPTGFQVEVSTLWAMDDFTEANGATRVIPGSTTWPDDHELDRADTVPAEMEIGSVILYSGSIFHGGGANRTDRARRAVNIGYCLGWLRQEENQYLSCPPEVARELPRELARLIGYKPAAYALGYFGDVQDPIEALHPR